MCDVDTFKITRLYLRINFTYLGFIDNIFRVNVSPVH